MWDNVPLLATYSMLLGFSVLAVLYGTFITWCTCRIGFR